MALATATNCWTQPEDELIASLSNSTAFRTWTGSANTVEAAARVHVEEATAPTDGQHYTAAERAALFPFALIMDPDDSAMDFTSSSTAVQGKHDYTPNGAKVLRFVGKVNSANPLTEEIRTFKNAAGDIIEEVLEQAGEDGRILPISVSLSLGVRLVKPEHAPNLGEEIICEWTFIFGFGEPE